jgi:integrase
VPSIRLTKLAVEKIAPPPSGRVIHWDRILPGFGLRVTTKGAKSWVAMYRVSGKTVMETLGTLARIPSVEDARQAARASMQKAAAGDNPVIEKRVEAARSAASTVKASVDRYLAHCDRTLKAKTAAEWRRIFEHDVLPRWGERAIAEITKADVLGLVDKKAGTRERKRRGAPEGAAVQAGKMLTRLRTFFGWAAANDLVTADPTAGVRKPAKEAQRDRVLADAEIDAFWTATHSMGNPFGHLFRLMLLTAQRESEVAGICWSELDDTEAPVMWTIPASRAKNGKPHIVRLSPLAAETIAAVPRIEEQDLLFSGTGKTPVSGFSGAKERLDRRMLDALRTKDEKAKLAPWTLHDLRRTATTGMARLGIAPHVADKVLNHTAGTIRGVAAVYNRFEYLDERAAALEAWSRYIEALIGRQPQNVVSLAKSR